MKMFTLLFLLGLVSCSQMAPTPKLAETPNREVASSRYLNDKSMRIINLAHIQVIDSEGSNTLPYKLEASKKVSDKTLAALLEASGDDVILSRIFVTEKGSSSFKNVYGFITQRIDTPDSSTFRLNIVFENKSGTLTLIDYDIYDATPRELKVYNGPSDALEKLSVFAETSFFPF
nr:hypothetical protein BHI3_13140 [Bacteriovorax sp. HI3]